jgi:ribosomal RNA-processing protein 8
MAPFHVPGWSMNNAPVSEQSSHLSKKRKRPSPRSIALESAEINFEKLVATLKDVKPDGNTSRTTDITDKKQKKRCRISEDVKHISPSNRKPVPPTPKNSSETFLKPNKQRKRKQDGTQNTSDSRLTSLQKNMKQNLDGARFR